MSAFELLKKEKTHLRRLARMRRDIYTRLTSLRAEAYRSREPVPQSEREGLPYRKISSGYDYGGLFTCAWFRFTGHVPEAAKGKRVVAHINVGGEGLIYRGSEPDYAVTFDSSYIDHLSSGLAKSIVPIFECAEGGEPVEIYLDAGYNGYYNYPVGHGRFRYADLCLVDEGLLKYYYDYLTLASLSCVCPAQRKKTINDALSASYALLPDAVAASAALAPFFEGTPDKSVEFTAIGHSHLDLAWLWPMRETKRKAARTFQHQIRNLERYPEYIYGISQPQQLAWIKATYPRQYERIKQLASEGRIELQGGMWVEADTNLSSGESLIRQILYGERFFREEFGKHMRICWLPDVFGYNGNLPQILKKSGLEYFMTIKLSWNEHNKFPHRSFVWCGVDGSEVLVHMPPAETYNSDASPACAAFARDNYPELGRTDKALMLFGIGDGGGGAGEAHIEMALRQNTLEGSPSVHMGTAEQFFDSLQNDRAALPVFEGELYLEKHQGTYTTQGRNKRFNRKCEYALADLEVLAAMTGNAPRADLERWWKEILLYQFHDIIPGSSITRVYVESRARYAELLLEINAKTRELVKNLPAGEKAFNPTSFARNEIVERDGQLMSLSAKPWGFGSLTPVEDAWLACGEDFIENSFVRVRFAKTGEITSLVTKSDGAEFAGKGLNVLRLYKDKFLFYNAWDIDWKYMNRSTTRLRALKSETRVEGARVVHRSIYRHGRTYIEQDVVLYADRGVVYFKTRADWHEVFRMLRADFDTAINASEVKCDIQMASLKRSALDETPKEKAQFEICAHKYVDISDGKRGLSLLNDCKYGHRAKRNFLSLNLLRSPLWPDPKADRGAHEFEYALFPHEGEGSLETVKHAYFLNKPPMFLDVEGAECIARTDNEAVVIETIKPSEDGRGVVLRLYECLGAPATCALKTSLKFERAVMCDLLENEEKQANLKRLEFSPFEIKTIKLI